MTQARSELEIDFQLRLATGSDGRGALIFDGSPGELVDRFYVNLVHALFPPGGSGESQLTVESTGGRELLYRTVGGENEVAIHLHGVPPEASNLVRTSLERFGAVPLLFGGTINGEFQMMDPLDNNIMRRMAIVDDTLVFGETYSDWVPFLTSLRDGVSIMTLPEQA